MKLEMDVAAFGGGTAAAVARRRDCRGCHGRRRAWPGRRRLLRRRRRVADDDAVRQMLVAQDGQWQQLSGLLQKRGIRRDHRGWIRILFLPCRTLRRSPIASGSSSIQKQDDPQFNRQAMQRFGSLWQSASTYLNP